MQRVVGSLPFGRHADVLGPVGHHGRDKACNALRFRLAQRLRNLARDVTRVQHARRHGVLNVVVHIGNMVCIAHHAPLARIGPGALRVADKAVQHLFRQVQALSGALQLFGHAHTLLIMAKAPRAQFIQRALSRMAEGRVAQIVPHGNGLGEVLVQLQGARDGARNLAHLQRVRQPRAVVVALR